MGWGGGKVLADCEHIVHLKAFQWPMDLQFMTPETNMIQTLLTTIQNYWFSASFLPPQLVSSLSPLITVTQLHQSACGSLSLSLLLCTYSFLLLAYSFPSCLFWNLSSFFILGYLLYLTQPHRHSEFCAPTGSFAGLCLSTYHTLRWLHLHVSFPTRQRAPWRQVSCLICLCIFITLVWLMKEAWQKH